MILTIYIIFGVVWKYYILFKNGFYMSAYRTRPLPGPPLPRRWHTYILFSENCTCVFFTMTLNFNNDYSPLRCDTIEIGRALLDNLLFKRRHNTIIWIFYFYFFRSPYFYLYDCSAVPEEVNVFKNRIWSNDQLATRTRIVSIAGDLRAWRSARYHCFRNVNGPCCFVFFFIFYFSTQYCNAVHSIRIGYYR
jgi:hypothetical protein